MVAAPNERKLVASGRRERRHFSAADSDEVIAAHADRVGVRAGVEVDGLNLEEASVVDRAEAEEKAERRNSALAQAGCCAQLLIGGEARALAADERREQLPI